MKIPPLDLLKQYEQIKDEVEPKILELCRSQSFILGKAVESFEQKVEAFQGAGHAIGVSSGTDALQLALMCQNIGPGDEVITTPFTFIATAEPITLLGAKPIFVDIDPKTFNLDPAKIEEKITDKTKCIIVVHLYGQTADMEPILKLAEKHDLKVIEDTAQAMGSVYGPTGQKAGSIGDYGTFSFFPSKNLGGFGDGGMVMAKHQECYEKIKRLRVHGSDQRYYHDEIGVNGRLDALQAVVLEVKLKYLDEWIQKRAAVAHFYNQLIKENGLDDFIEIPFVEKENFHTYHQYVLKFIGESNGRGTACRAPTRENRDALINHLNAADIGARIYYPVPLQEQKCFAYLGYQKGDLPATDLASEQIFSLPIYPELTQEEQIYIVDKIKEFFM